MLTRLCGLIVVFSAMFAVVGFASTAQAQEKKVDATGTWKWTSPARNGGAGRESILKLKQDGDKLTGTMSGQTEAEIKDGKVVDGTVSFKIVRSRNGTETVMSYEGKLEGDTIKGTITRTGGTTPAQPRDWEAKREVAVIAPVAPAK